MTNKKVVPEKTPDKSSKDNNHSSNPPKEVGGRNGPEPIRYGDWENRGIASDF